ncbi:hypothetical protein NQZ68_001085, partial [Dissostichus eleginoides]
VIDLIDQWQESKFGIARAIALFNTSRLPELLTGLQGHYRAIQRHWFGRIKPSAEGRESQINK